MGDISHFIKKAKLAHILRLSLKVHFHVQFDLSSVGVLIGLPEPFLHAGCSRQQLQAMVSRPAGATTYSKALCGSPTVGPLSGRG